jgi:hypothetical protein
MWDWAIYGALMAGALAVLGAAALVGVRALRAWRSFKRLRRHIGRELERLAELGDATSNKLESAADTSTLERELAELRVTLRRFALLREALDEALDSFRRIAVVYPRK